jgi:hypothetical protein
MKVDNEIKGAFFGLRINLHQPLSIFINQKENGSIDGRLNAGFKDWSLKRLLKEKRLETHVESQA